MPHHPNVFLLQKRVYLWRYDLAFFLWWRIHLPPQFESLTTGVMNEGLTNTTVLTQIQPNFIFRVCRSNMLVNHVFVIKKNENHDLANWFRLSNFLPPVVSKRFSKLWFPDEFVGHSGRVMFCRKRWHKTWKTYLFGSFLLTLYKWQHDDTARDVKVSKKFGIDMYRYQNRYLCHTTLQLRTFWIN